ncbi:hypothetical protein HIM_05157 [Hirsutella minnesotensis 3608]|uniref:Enoyl reductase (ER) domain-containing protein n=1 Tax=Hirsutella minnesotensis 3608 TaxID=1043627 RepID=A0A0F7ZKP1_9HYPO|nr:hypothetical protein HIM_05157 [Hirsutella minnesotensis 3608]
MTSLPKTYKAVVLASENGPFELKEVELKRPGPRQILIKVLACGVCLTDVGVADGHFGNVFPRTPGHEIVGTVVDVGEGSPFSIGQRVGGPWHGGHDSRCRSCQRGMFQMCDQKDINGVTRDGGYAEYALLRAEAVVRLPQDCDPAETAPLLCAGVTVFNGIRRLQVSPGALVAVQGVGGLGHLAVQYADKMGYEVVVLSSGDDKAKFAKELGARHYINTKTSNAVEELKKLGGADIIVQTAPNPDALAKIIRALAPGGKMLSLAPVGPAPIETGFLVNQGASVHGWPSGHALDSEEAIRFASSRGIKCMIEKYPLDKVQDAVESLKAGKPRFRNVLIME